jgi:hypothetical protein
MSAFSATTQVINFRLVDPLEVENFQSPLSPYYPLWDNDEDPIEWLTPPVWYKKDQDIHDENEEASEG